MAALDCISPSRGLASRPAAVQKAIAPLDDPALVSDYATAWQGAPPARSTRGGAAPATVPTGRRGEIRLANLDPAQGDEASRRRPAVIVGNDCANAVAERSGRGPVTIVPVTSNVERIYPFRVLLPADESGLRLDWKARAEHERWVRSRHWGRCLAG